MYLIHLYLFINFFLSLRYYLLFLFVVVVQDIVKKFGKISAIRLRPISNMENAVVVSNRERKEKQELKEKEIELLKEKEREHNIFEKSSFSSREKIFTSDKESNDERKKYLKERSERIFNKKNSSGSSVQRSGNRRNQFGDLINSAETTSGVLLDIVGRDMSGMEKSILTKTKKTKRKKKKKGTYNPSDGGKMESGEVVEGGANEEDEDEFEEEEVLVVQWKLKTAVGPDGGRGFNTEYQKSRGRMIRSLSVEAVAFTPSSF